MNIVHIIPGSGGSFYCGNCLRDSKLFDAIRAEGHDAVKIPMYLPLFAHDMAGNKIPVFYGAISIYLKQQFAFFRNAPEWLDKLLNSKPMLQFAAHMANSTRASGLEEMTISMLMGEEGMQKDELEKMVHWLETHLKPDVIHISNALLLGLAHQLKQRLQIPLVCSLQDEDVWVNHMHPEVAEKVWGLMREKAADVDMFIAVSRYYTSFMKEKMQLPDNKITTMHLGVDPVDYQFINAIEKQRFIGYLSRLCYDNGLDILIDAFILIRQNKDFADVRLLLTGGQTADDKAFIKIQKKKLRQANLISSVEFIDDFDSKQRNEFFNKVMLLSVPVRNGEAFGIYLTEAMAAGIPVVQPALGAFPEIIAQSGGGITYQQNTPEKLAEALKKLMNDKSMISQLSLQAQKGTQEAFNIHAVAKKMISLYEQVAKKK